MNRIKGIIYHCIGLLATFTAVKKRGVKRLLIIRIDEIGDYMLWRNFLSELIHAPRFSEYSIDFCGNQSWRSLFQQLDATDRISQQWWLDKVRFKKDMIYRYRFLQNIAAQGYEVVINPTYSRDKRYDDSIVSVTHAAERWGMVANLESIQAYEEGYDRGLYNHLFDHKEKPVFELYRNQYFTAFVTGQASAVNHTRINLQALPTFSQMPTERFFVVFPGSRSAARIWPTAHFVAVSNYLYEQYQLTAVVCGAGGDRPYTAAFCESYQHPVIDMTGKTSLPEMLTLLHHASLLISVDTGSVHLATAVDCPVYGIFNGSQYQRFAPYPTSMAPKFHAIYPEEIRQELQDPSIVRAKYEFVVNIPYASVSPNDVIEVLQQHFSL